MLNENAQKLVRALRSGLYPQSRYRLRTPEGYCCLGVACDIYRQETGVGEWAEGDPGDDHNGQPFVVDTYDSNNAMLPTAVRVWLGFRSSGGHSYHEDPLYALNDNLVPFEEIANVIESEPEGLFA